MAGAAYLLALFMFVMAIATATEEYYGGFLLVGWLSWLLGVAATIRIVWEARE